MNISANVVAFGGDEPYTYNWNDGSTGNSMEINMPISDWEIPLSYAVTVTDQCGNEKTAFHDFVCQDLCPDDCIKAYKTGKPQCTDYCNDHPLYGEDIGCDKIKIKCDCDDGVTRRVLWKNGWEEAIFVGKEPQEGSYLEEKVNTWSPGTYIFYVHNEKTDCVSKKVLSRISDRCGTGFFPWLVETFGGPKINTPPDDPCGDEDDWELEHLDETTCVETYRCIAEPERKSSKKISKKCKYQDPNSNLWAEIEFCEPSCNILGVLNSTESEPSGMSDCPSCLAFFTDPCDDPLDLFTYPGTNGWISFVKNKDKDHFITKILDETGTITRTLVSEDIESYLLKYIRTTRREVLAILLHKGTLEYSLIRILRNQEYEVIKTFEGEIVEKLFVSGVEATSAQIITRDKSTREYRKYVYDMDNKSTTLLSERHTSTGKIIWSTINNYFEVTSNSGFNYVAENGVGFIRSNTIDSSVKIKTIDEYLGGYIVTGIYTGTLNINDQIFNSINQYSTIIYWFDTNGILIRVNNLENKIITRTSIKNNIMVYMGYNLESYFISEEFLEETIYLQNSNGPCSFLDVIDLTDPSNFQNVENINTRNAPNFFVEIFPNPTKNSVFVKIKTADFMDEKKFSIEVRNILGVKVGSYIINREDNVNLSEYVSGIYLLNILDKEGNIIFTEKIVKQ